MNTRYARPSRILCLCLTAGWFATVPVRAEEEAWAVQLDALRVKVTALAAERQQQRSLAEELGRASGEILTRVTRAKDAVLGRKGAGAVLRLLLKGATDQPSLGAIMEEALRRRDALVGEASGIAEAAGAAAELALSLGDWPGCQPDLARLNADMEGLRVRLDAVKRDLDPFRRQLGMVRAAANQLPAVRAAAKELQAELGAIKTEIAARKASIEKLLSELTMYDIKRETLLRQLATEGAVSPPEGQAGFKGLEQMMLKLPGFPSTPAILQLQIQFAAHQKVGDQAARDLDQQMKALDDLARSVQGRPFASGVLPVWNEWQTAAVPMLDSVQRLLDACAAQRKRIEAQELLIDESLQRFRRVAAEAQKQAEEAGQSLRDLEARAAASAGEEKQRLETEAQAERERLAGLEAVQQDTARAEEDARKAAENAQRKKSEVEKARQAVLSDSGSDLLEFNEDAVQLPPR